MRLRDKVAVITGGGRGIGRAVALGFARQGAAVVVAARSVGEVEQTVRAVEADGGRALAVACDVTDEQAVRGLIGAALERFGRIDVLVNNAGVGNLRPVWGTPRSAFERTLAVNLIGTFLTTKHAWKPLRAAGGGSIINVASLGGLRGYALLSAYCASKWGQIGFTMACAEEGKADGIRANVVAPGKADTAFRAQIEEDKSRMLQAEDVLGACVFLASDEARYVTGQVIAVDWFGPDPGG